MILGPNGCGKTSLLRALTGYLPASSGSINLLGSVYGRADWQALRRRVGIVTSALQTSIPNAEPVIETVISGRYAQLDLWVKTTRSDRAEALKLLRLAGLAPLAEREWILLSQGERQRVLIARALMARPELLILDEPCSGLDPVAREHFLGLMERIAARPGSPALVLVTHHVEEITPSFTHALLLRQGRLIAAGALRETLTSGNLSAAFGAKLALQRKNGVYRLALPRSARQARRL